MNIDIKYNIGDKVKWRKSQELNQYETCSFCNGAKEVQGADNTVLPCPKCHGRGTTKVLGYIDGIGKIIGMSINYNSEYMTKLIVAYRLTDGIDVEQDEIVEKINN